MTTSTIQALATGLPAIATHHSGFPDLIKDGQNGFLVEEGNYQALAQKILYMIDHSEIWPKFGRFGRQHVLENYDSGKLIDRQIAIYQGLLNR